MKIAVTGGIASGKSAACQFLLSILSKHDSVHNFSCDEAVSHLLTQRQIAANLAEGVGSNLLDEDGTLDRTILREAIFSSPSNRQKVEEILHPHVLEAAKAFIKERKTGILLIEVPLLYEVDFPINRELDLVIGCSRQTQISRIVSNRGLDQPMAEQILESQLPIETKLDRADVVIWNDGNRNSFEDQLSRFARNLIGSYKSNDKG